MRTIIAVITMLSSCFLMGADSRKSKLKVGLTEKQARSIMGLPTSSVGFDGITRHFYPNCTVVFNNGKLVRLDPPNPILGIKKLPQKKSTKTRSKKVAKTSTKETKANTTTSNSNKWMHSTHQAENGDLQGRDNDGDGRREPIHVRGYYRKDGTYVRGHYRARSRK